MELSRLYNVILTEAKEEEFLFHYNLYLETLQKQTDANLKTAVTFDVYKTYFDTSPNYSIFVNDRLIGHTYIDNRNKITCELITECDYKGIGQKVLDKLMKLEKRPFYLMEILPGNNQAIKFAVKNDFEKIFETYVKKQ